MYDEASVCDYMSMSPSDSTAKAAKRLDDALLRDAARYRYLRSCTWDTSPIAVVVSPKVNTVLGAVCPSGGQLDEYIDGKLVPPAPTLVAALQHIADCGHKMGFDAAAYAASVLRGDHE